MNLVSTSLRLETAYREAFKAGLDLRPEFVARGQSPQELFHRDGRRRGHKQLPSARFWRS